MQYSYWALYCQMQKAPSALLHGSSIIGGGLLVLPKDNILKFQENTKLFF